MKKFLLTGLLFPLLIAAQSWTDQNSGISNDLRDVYFLNNNEGWAVGRQGKVIHTTNGGSTWTQQNSGTVNDLNKVHMVSASVGYAVGNNGTFIKYNGTSWSTMSIGFSQAMHGVYFLDASTGWISGDWGRIMKTTNGGTSWTTQMDNGTFTNLFYDLHMLSANEGWAVGTSGRVLRYNGTTWSNFTNPSSADLYSVHFSSANNGFMTGRNSTVYHFNGTSWSQQSTDLPDNSYHVKGVWVIGTNIAYAATTAGFGGVGIILKYNGSTWAKDYEYTGIGGEYFDAVMISPGGKGFVVGAGGQIKSANTGVSSITENSRSMVNVMTSPNPFNDSFTLSVDENDKIVSWQINDVCGRNVMGSNELHDADVLTIESGILNSGVYFLNVKTQKGNSIKRLVKE